MKKSIFLMCLLIAQLFALSTHAASDPRSIKGTVVDTEGEPLIGATVQVEGTSVGVSTDIDGNFVIRAAVGQTLLVSYVGYSPKKVKVTDSTADLRVELSLNAEMLEDVVVVGYGVMKKKDLTGAITQIDPNKIADSNPQTVQDILRGAAGLQVGYDPSAKGGGSLELRGKNSLGTESSPLIILDGMQFYGELSEINPDDIKQIDILKDSSSAAIYGAKAANGVIIVTTKSGSNTGKPSVTFSANWGINTRSSYRKYYDAAGYLNYRSDWYKRDTYGVDANGNYVAYQSGQTNPGYYDYPSEANLAKYGITLDQWMGYSSNAADESPRSVFGRRIGLDEEALVFENFLNNETFDWYNYAFRTGLNQDYNIGLSGGTEKMNYYMSVGYMKNQGVVKGNDYNTLRASMRLSANVTKWLQIGANVNFQHRSDGDKALSYSDDLQKPNIMKFSPYASMYDKQTGELLQFPMGGTNRFQPFQNQFFYQNYEELEKGYMVLNSKFFAKVTLPFGITYQFNVSPRYQYFWDRYFMSADLPESAKKDRGVNREWGKRFDWSLNNTINWDYTFNDVHHVMVTLAQEAEDRRYWSDRIEARGFDPTDALGFHNTQNATKELSNFRTNDTHESADALLARVFYGYDNRYMLTASVRRDGYSAFGQNYPHATFPSLAVAWNFANEKFMAPISDIWSTGKLRLSWGKNGNRDLGNPYIALANLGSGQGKTMNYLGPDGEVISDLKYLTMSRMANPDLRWEKTESFNIGLDLGFFNNRLNLSADWYYKKTNDMIMNMALPGFSGFTEVATNIGRVDNTGFELSLNTLNIANNVLEWNTNVTFSYNKNKIRHIDYQMENVLDENGNIIGQKEIDQPSKGWFVGQPIGVIWDYKVDGIWQADQAEEAAKVGQKPGDYRVQNYYTGDDIVDPVTGERTPVYNDKDKQFLGQTTPPVYLSMRNDFTLWKDFTISFTFYSKLGHKSRSWSYANGDNASDIIVHGLNTYEKEYWTPETPSDYFARLNARGPNGATSVPRVINRNFLRLSDLTFGYTLPRKWTQKAYMEKVRVSFGIKNLFTINPPKWSYGDPEDGNGLGTRLFNFGINVTF